MALFLRKCHVQFIFLKQALSNLFISSQCSPKAFTNCKFLWLHSQGESSCARGQDFSSKEHLLQQWLWNQTDCIMSAESQFMKKTCSFARPFCVTYKYSNYGMQPTDFCCFGSRIGKKKKNQCGYSCWNVINICLVLVYEIKTPKHLLQIRQKKSEVKIKGNRD